MRGGHQKSFSSEEGVFFHFRVCVDGVVVKNEAVVVFGQVGQIRSRVRVPASPCSAPDRGGFGGFHLNNSWVGCVKST